MGELGGNTILIVVENENRSSQFIRDLQAEIGRTGAKTVVDHPDTVANALATFKVSAAIVSVERQLLVENMKVPVVVYYADDASGQVLARLRRVLTRRHDEAEPEKIGRGFSWRGRVIFLLLVLLASIVVGAAIRWALTQGLG